VPNVTLNPLQTQQFTATVANNSNTGVMWGLNPNIGTISNSGLYTAPATITSLQTVEVTAASVAFPSRTASATVTLNPAPTLTAISPASGGQGSGLGVQLTGTNFDGESTITVSNPGVTFNGIYRLTFTTAMAWLSIAPDAARARLILV
jgi:hypothetical protein